MKKNLLDIKWIVNNNKKTTNYLILINHIKIINILNIND
jgi:hypothetical protein